MDNRKKYSYSIVLLISLASLLRACTGEEVDLRQQADQVAIGKTLYAQHCAKCHGAQGQGDPKWRQRDDDGHWPPPPLNGSGHTWHHSVAWLKRMIQNGSPKGKGKMPAWKTVLNEKETLAVIAYIQTLWPDKIYQHWRKLDKR